MRCCNDDRSEQRLKQPRMTESRERVVNCVLGPDGPITISDLPCSTATRWVVHRKAEVIAAVRGGLLSLDEACARYALTEEEFLAWQRLVGQYGLLGLRSTRIQQNRKDTRVRGYKRWSWNQHYRCESCTASGVVTFSQSVGHRIGDDDTRMEVLPAVFRGRRRNDGLFDIYCINCNQPISI
jgi:hypothetical protein